jgi:hypothetical protein
MRAEWDAAGLWGGAARAGGGGSRGKGEAAQTR